MVIVGRGDRRRVVIQIIAVLSDISTVENISRVVQGIPKAVTFLRLLSVRQIAIRHQASVTDTGQRDVDSARCQPPQYLTDSGRIIFACPVFTIRGHHDRYAVLASFTWLVQAIGRTVPGKGRKENHKRGNLFQV